MENRLHLMLIFVIAGPLALALIGCAPEPDALAPTATASSTGAAIPAQTAAPTSQVWWQQELYEVADVGDGGTYLMAPQEVIAQVIAHYDNARALAQMDTLEAYKAALPRYFTGVMLREQIAQAPEAIRYEIRLEGFHRTYEVKDFAPDGLGCTVGVRQQDGKVFLRDRATGETVEAFSDTLTIVRMRYDLQDARWKGAELLDIIELGR